VIADFDQFVQAVHRFSAVDGLIRFFNAFDKIRGQSGHHDRGGSISSSLTLPSFRCMTLVLLIVLISSNPLL
jgi:hypothetical protein